MTNVNTNSSMTKAQILADMKKYHTLVENSKTGPNGAVVFAEGGVYGVVHKDTNKYLGLAFFADPVLGKNTEKLFGLNLSAYQAVEFEFEDYYIKYTDANFDGKYDCVAKVSKEGELLYRIDDIDKDGDFDLVRPTDGDPFLLLEDNEAPSTIDLQGPPPLDLKG